MNSDTLVKKLKSGDISVLKIIYELYYKQTFQAAFFITRDIGLAEDIVHEIFIKLKDKIEQLDDHSKFGSWLCQMSTNLARDLIKHRSKSSLVEDMKSIYNDEQLVSPETVFMNKEEQLLVKKYIESLNAEHKQIIYLKYFQDLSLAEISNIIKLPLGTVKSRLYHARKEIKKIIESKIKCQTTKKEIY